MKPLPYTYFGHYSVGPDGEQAGAWRIYRLGLVYNAGPLWDRAEAERVAAGLAEEAGWCPECSMTERRHRWNCARVN